MILDKPTIRKQMLAKRQALSPEMHAQAARKITPKLLSEISEGVCVAGYAAIKGELDLLPSLRALFARGNTLCLPVIEHKDAPLVFHAWEPGEALIKGSYAIEIPKDGHEVIPDVVLVPLVAFDERGYRVGYGAGYYDQTISRLRKSMKRVTFIGVGYDFQRIEQLPAEPHDERLDKVITVS